MAFFIEMFYSKFTNPTCIGVKYLLKLLIAVVIDESG